MPLYEIVQSGVAVFETWIRYNIRSRHMHICIELQSSEECKRMKQKEWEEKKWNGKKRKEDVDY